MFKWLLKRMKKNNKGFTLVELVVVIAILGILAAIAVPKLTASRKDAAITAHNANVKVLMNAANMYIAENGEPTADNFEWNKNKKTGDDGWGKYLQEWPEVPDGLKEEDFNDQNLSKDTDGKIIYTVKIDKNGDITVTPDVISDTDN